MFFLIFSAFVFRCLGCRRARLYSVVEIGASARACGSPPLLAAGRVFPRRCSSAMALLEVVQHRTNACIRVLLIGGVYLFYCPRPWELASVALALFFFFFGPRGASDERREIRLCLCLSLSLSLPCTLQRSGSYQTEAHKCIITPCEALAKCLARSLFRGRGGARFLSSARFVVQSVASCKLAFVRGSGGGRYSNAHTAFLFFSFLVGLFVNES